ncbi:MAG TPA: serine/threonine-protein kinase, partial [Isosphaeraceae bacterium]
MSPDPDSIPPEPWQVEALLAFDAALAAGHEPAEAAGAGPPLHAAHECQRLLEWVWPRAAPVPGDLPRRFGRFLLVRELGRGGFGVVFLARDTSLGREVALKLPRPGALVSPEDRRRFLREGEAAGRLDHPHIVPVYELGEYDGICYIASAYCEGGTLGGWLRGRTSPIPVREAAALVAALAGAVGHAHARGIVHRDLKPGNVLLQRPAAGAAGGGGDPDFIPRLGDFGLAKVLGDDANDTRSGALLGSPAYMAPEQAAGRAREIGPATDVFALGVILYELLAGRPPFQGE